MRLFHVSISNEEIKGFTPRIPYSVAKGEEIDTPRICVSETIEGALSAVLWGGANLVFWQERNPTTPIKVYEFESNSIPQENLVSPEELFKNNWVRDGLYNKEWWVINQQLTPKRSYLILIDYFIEEYEDEVDYDVYMAYKKGELSEDDYLDRVEGSYTMIDGLTYTIVEETKKTCA